MVISLFILLVPLVSSIEFSFISPETVNVEEEFSIEIISQESGNYDVKAFVHEHTKQHSEIFHAEAWKSPFNYISSAFPSQKEFKLKSHFVGETRICVRLRETGTSNFVEKCNELEVLSSENPSSSEEILSGAENSNQELKKDVEQIDPSVTSQYLSAGQKLEPDKIVLNTPKLDEVETEDSEVKKEKTRKWINYSFLSLLLLILILLILKKL